MSASLAGGMDIFDRLSKFLGICVDTLNGGIAFLYDVLLKSHCSTL